MNSTAEPDPSPRPERTRTETTEGRSVAATVVLLLAATVIESFGPGHPGWGAVAALIGVAVTMAAGITLARRPGSRWLFRAVLLAAAIDVIELVARGSRL